MSALFHVCEAPGYVRVTGGDFVQFPGESVLGMREYFAPIEDEM